MRSLEDVFEHLDGKRTGSIERKILFEDGEWCMYKREGFDTDVYVVHRCSKARYALGNEGTHNLI